MTPEDMYKSSEVIIKAFTKQNPTVSIKGMAFVSELGNDMLKEDQPDDKAQRLFHTMLNLALVGYITTNQVREGVSKEAGADLFGMLGDLPDSQPKPKDEPGPGNLNFL